MSLEHALRFISSIRTRPPLREVLDGTLPGLGIGELVELGAHYGCDFSAEELRAAFRADWIMREMHRRAASAASPDGAATRRAHSIPDTMSTPQSARRA